jgi:hypothetical protein
MLWSNGFSYLAHPLDVIVDTGNSACDVDACRQPRHFVADVSARNG